MGDPIPDAATGERQGRFPPASRLRFARAARGLGSLGSYRPPMWWDARAAQRDSGCASRNSLRFRTAGGRHVVRATAAGGYAAHAGQEPAYPIDRTRFLYDHADPAIARTWDRATRSAGLAGHRGGER